MNCESKAIYSDFLYMKEGASIISKKKLNKIRPIYRLNPQMSHAAYKKKLSDENPNVEVLEPYRNMKTPILHRCKICGKAYMAKPANVLNAANGCPQCGLKRCGDKTRSNNGDFLRKLKEKGRTDLIPLEPYINAKTHINFQCTKCGNIWSATPTTILSGHGCPKCGKTPRKTNDVFIKELEEANPTIETMGQYVGTYSRIQVRCKKCGYIWSPYPDTLLRGHGCPECARQASIIPEAEVLDRIRSFSNDIEFIGTYNGANIYTDMKCNKCGHIWNVQPAQLLKGFGCPNCNNIKRTKTNEQYLQDLKDKQIEDVIPLEPYNGAQTPILHKCQICGNEWKISPDNVLHRHGCPKCANKQMGLKRRLSQDEFIEHLHEIHGNTIMPLEPYQNMETPIKFKCSECGKEWYADPGHILRGHGCWECNSSQGEKRIIVYLTSHNIAYEPQKTYENLKGIGGKKIRYDFYLPEYNLLIEYDGIQHFEPVEYFGGEEKFELQKEHDRRKEEYAQQHGIPLLHIKYTEDVNTVLNSYLNNLKLESRETVMAV